MPISSKEALRPIAKVQARIVGVSLTAIMSIAINRRQSHGDSLAASGLLNRSIWSPLCENNLFKL